MDYQDIIDLGFSHIEDTDDNFKKVYGYEYFRVEYYINKQLSFEWDLETHLVTMIKTEKDGYSIIEEWVIKDIEILKNLIRVLGKSKKKHIYGQIIA